jgi:dienelactone hydrolase
MWQTKLGDIADVDKVEYTSLPPHHAANPNAPGATNPLIIHAYTFIPKKLDRSRSQPLIVLIHGGVHAKFAPDYRGSTGYGRGFYEEIDYGGREVDDVFAGCQWMLGEHDFLDPKRVGILGWSHGGLITLMNIFQHPQAYAVAYAGVPVSDLVARMGYESEGYRQQYSAPYHIGKTVREDIQEYLKLIHSNTIDEDVNVLEVQHLIDSLEAAGGAAPGGHRFNRTDTKLAQDSRREVYASEMRELLPNRDRKGALPRNLMERSLAVAVR